MKLSMLQEVVQVVLDQVGHVLKHELKREMRACPPDCLECLRLAELEEFAMRPFRSDRYPVEIGRAEAA